MIFRHAFRSLTWNLLENLWVLECFSVLFSFFLLNDCYVLFSEILFEFNQIIIFVEIVYKNNLEDIFLEYIISFIE